ncbi:class I adenylate-forming enzyme family protein [Gordonia alkanivorans]|uniref:class I adenylate-forming enzyme family protein n=1 Tax=Gordonia alkanivorans TaxID=84096 RepID=UPI0024B85720|nr:class I adenylate-forming enzyme family protein [Gordonia alkanivorans]MDJ0006405.1 class I adenylate-forming enzyme family protein [Gordonia alkanivorans]MDJ0097086.1 class I adenylate-forming enzyme family protein [Gordonia alkanivorans]MDJ0492033.1 class I adenylate-forming enzyme family protein [Gordonia alkanivorans]
MSAETVRDLVWGEEVVEAAYAGHPGRIYAKAPGSLVDLLRTAGPWNERDFLVQRDMRIGHTAFHAAIPAAAAYLAALGVSRGDRVMLHSYNRPEFALATCAVWWLGAVPVYANRWWSADESRHAIEVSAPVLVLTDTPELFGDVGIVVRSIADLTACWTNPVPHEPTDGVDLDDPALILFTSGSSGAPKAVALSSRSVITNQQNLLVRSRRLPHNLAPDTPQQVALVCTPLFHIGGVSNILTNLLIGGRMVMTAGKFDAGEILRLIEAERVQTWGGVPTMAIRLLEHPDFDAHDLSSLRSFPLGGAPLPPALLDRMTTKLPQLKRRGLANTWGMTETGGFMTVAGNADLAERPGTVGRPYPVVEVRIDAPDDRGIGEVLVRAPTVMLGYVGLDDGTVDTEGWLHTGDLGHLDPDGYLYLDGRSKDIVIRGGENIACAHIEKAILGHPSIVEAAVFGVPHDDLGEELAAVVTHRAAEPVSVDDLVAHCRTTLAYFEVPTHWRIDDTPLPTLAGEKLNKKAIKADFIAAGLEG